MIRYLFKSQLATFRSQLSLYLLTLIGVSLGVASVLAIQVINLNAIGAFQGGFRAVMGETDLVVQGRSPRLSEETVPIVLSTPGVDRAVPLFRVQLQLGEGSGNDVEMVATDLTIPPEGIRKAPTGSLEEALFSPGWALFSKDLVEEMGWERGQELTAYSGSRKFELVVGEVADFAEAGPQASSRMVLMDIGQAQHLLGARGEIHEISVSASPGVDPESLAERLRDRLGPAVLVSTPSQERRRTTDILSAFRLNLTALSLISVFVGGFLIYCSTQASLLRRRREFGLLRSLGATSTQVLLLILVEVCLVAVIGVLIGVPLGYWAARANIETVNSTLTSIYLLDAIRSVEFPTRLLLFSILVGLGSALAAALIPALDMSRKNTSELMAAFVLRERVSRSALPLFAAGLAILSLCLLLAALKGLTWKPAGFVLGIGVLVALPMTAPLLILKTCGSVPIGGFGLTYSIRGLADRLQTTAFAVAALAVAISMLIGITLMIGSFRETVRVWLETSVAADIYISGKGGRGSGLGGVDESVAGRLEALSSIESVDRIRTFPYDWNDRRVLVNGVEISSPRSRQRYPLLSGDPETAFEAMRQGTGLFVSEPLARKAGIAVGDTLMLTGEEGVLRLPVAGITYDYTSDSGLITLSLERVEEAFGSSPVSSLAVYTSADSSAGEALTQIRRRLSDVPLNLTSSRELRINALRIFDQTFAVVRILQVMSLVIAASAITLTLIILARERASELALYRALGALRLQIFKLYLGKGMAISGLSILLGMIGGFLLAALLIFVINRTYFGWTIQIYFPARALLEEIGIILLAALLASLYPALRASRTPATELTRDDL